MDKRVFYLIGLSALIFLPGMIFAQKDEITPLLCTFFDNLLAAATAGIGISWAVVVVLFIMSSGNPERVNLAKKGLTVALIGTVIIILGTTSLKMVGNAMGLTKDGDICQGVGGGCPEGECRGSDGVCSVGNCH